MANFAKLEHRTKACVLKHLSNAQAQLMDTGARVRVIFDDGGKIGLTDVFEASQPTCLGAAEDLAALAHGQELGLLNQAGELAAMYVVAGSQPDGTGLTRLMLERQP